jgi:hypothetical protein
MCYSAEASLIVGAGTGVVGCAAYQRMRSTPLKWLALVPCFFAVQQASEGIVWLHLNSHSQSTVESLLASYLYLFFALIFWPLYSSFAVLMSERIHWKRILCIATISAGLLIAVYNISELILIPEAPTVVGQSIHYGYADGPYPSRILYGFVAMMPLFVSSLRRLWILGTLALSGFIISDYFYYEVFTSVWCFFAATFSVLLYFILKANENTVAVSDARRANLPTAELT